MDRSIKAMPKHELENFLEKNLSDPVTRRDIERLEIYDRDSLSLFDRRGTGPERIPGCRRATYPKQPFIAWLLDKRFGVVI